MPGNLSALAAGLFITTRQGVLPILERSCIVSAYSSLLRDPRWQRKRLEVLEAVDWTCENCGAQSKELQVHHVYYKKGAKPWEYENIDKYELLVFCADCHGKFTELQTALALKMADYASGEPNQRPYTNTLEVLNALFLNLTNTSGKNALPVGVEGGYDLAKIILAMNAMADALPKSGAP